MKLIVLKNNLPLSEVNIDTSDRTEMYEVFIGRSEDCHVRIDDPLISRHHFVLKTENGSWFCEKLSNLGVITVQGLNVTKNIINNNDEIRFGAYSIVVMGLTPVLAPMADESLVHAPVQNNDLTEIIPSKNIETKPLVEEVSSNTLEESSDSNQEESTFSENLDDDFGSEVSNDDFGSEVESSTEESSEMNFSDDAGTGFGEEASGSSDEFGMAALEDDQESTRFFKAFINYQLVIFGEYAPYDRYQIDSNEVFIGRDPNRCQIVLNDPEVSSVHAVLRKNMVEITLEDLGSSNGTILNGERINKASLSTNDEFVIGSTSFSLETQSDLLESEADRLMPVEEGQVIETEEVEEEIVTMDGDGELSFDSSAPPEKSIIKRIWKDPAKRKKAIYALTGVVLVWFLFGDDSPKPEEKVAEKTEKEAPAAEPQKVLPKELENARNVAYELGVNFFEQFRYDLAEPEFQKVVSIDPNYKKVQSYLEETRAGLKHLAEIEAQKKAEEERIKTRKIIEELLVKAREAVKEKNVTMAENYFSQIIEKDPENIEVSQLKLELESWQKEQERIALEKAAKDASRKRMVDSLAPGKTFYLKKEWYKAILKLEEFLRIKGTDEDLVKEASDMLSDSKNQLASELGPLIGKARSLKEGQDLKSAYEAFLEILKMEPTNSEALNEVDSIKNQLEMRAKRVYREAIISESLSLFTEAKEKYQEVQQISPTDSEYYKKASDKLKNYLE